MVSYGLLIIFVHNGRLWTLIPYFWHFVLHVSLLYLQSSSRWLCSWSGIYYVPLFFIRNG